MPGFSQVTVAISCCPSGECGEPSEHYRGLHQTADCFDLDSVPMAGGACCSVDGAGRSKPRAAPPGGVLALGYGIKPFQGRRLGKPRLQAHWKDCRDRQHLHNPASGEGDLIAAAPQKELDAFASWAFGYVKSGIALAGSSSSGGRPNRLRNLLMLFRTTGR